MSESHSGKSDSIATYRQIEECLHEQQCIRAHMRVNVVRPSSPDPIGTNGGNKLVWPQEDIQDGDLLDRQSVQSPQ